MTKNSEKLVCVVENTGNVNRMPISQASKLVNAGLASFCPKSEWKKAFPELHEKNVKHEEAMREKKAASEKRG